MAAKKKSKKKVAKKKAGKGMISMSDFEKEMEEQAESDSARVESSGGGTHLSIAGSTFTLGDADLGDELVGVIIDFANEKVWYDGVYNPDDPGAPACWAIGTERPNELVTSELSPVPQCESCEDCEKNEWGSAATGRGKACQDKRRLMVVSMEDLMEAESLEDIEVAMLKAPAGSVSAYDKYIKGLSKVHKRPCYGVTTLMTFDDEVDYPSLNFAVDEVIEDASIMSRIMELRSLVEEDLVSEYDPDQYKDPEEKSPKRSKKKAKKKKGFKKKK